MLPTYDFSDFQLEHNILKVLRWSKPCPCIREIVSSTMRISTNTKTSNSRFLPITVVKPAFWSAKLQKFSRDATACHIIFLISAKFGIRILLAISPSWNVYPDFQVPTKRSIHQIKFFPTLQLTRKSEVEQKKENIWQIYIRYFFITLLKHGHQILFWFCYN